MPNIFGDAKYGYGLFVENDRGLHTVWHDGGMPGFSCMLKMVPAQRCAVIILANNEGVRLVQTMDKALALMLPLQAKSAAKVKPARPMSVYVSVGFQKNF